MLILKRFIMKKLLVSLLCIICAHTAFSQADKDVTAIRKLLFMQVSEWNKGNIEGYMHGYWESDSLLFIGSKGPRYGYNATLTRYKEAYPDADHMGKLTSTITSMQKLSDDYYFIVGKWALQRKAGDVDGSYTLLLKKIKGKWVIVCDHSS
jgi:ketosteroid isomerase-like protein